MKRRNEQLGRARGLTAISGHSNYWLWGRPATAATSSSSWPLRRRQAGGSRPSSGVGVVDCGDCMPYENGQFIFICRGLKPPSLSERWIEFKHYD
jgi:hypothetical protein